jgi:hypothetical protein
MIKDLSSKLVKIARLPAVTANSSDVITTICDMGDCQNATAIVSFEYTTDSVTDLGFWTSSSDTSGVTGTAQSATTNTVAVEIASDADSLQAWNGNTRIVNLAVSSNLITSLAQDGVIAVELPNIRRHLYAQYNNAGTGSTMSITFIGKDPSGSERPWTGGLTAY